MHSTPQEPLTSEPVVLSDSQRAACRAIASAKIQPVDRAAVAAYERLARRARRLSVHARRAPRARSSHRRVTAKRTSATSSDSDGEPPSAAPLDGADVMTVDEAAAWLRVGRNQLYEAIGRGAVPHLRIGRTIRLSRAALQGSLAGSCGAASTDRRR